MSFIKITNPAKREAIVRDYLKTKANIYAQSQEQKIGNIADDRKNVKFFKPVIESQHQLSEDIKSQERFLKEITAAVNALPEQIDLPKHLPLQDVEHFYPQAHSSLPTTPYKTAYQYGPMAARSFFKSQEHGHDHDTTFGLYSKSNKHYIGDKRVDIDHNNLIIDGENYEGTEGLWELIRSKTPMQGDYTPEDLSNYEKILIQTNAIWKDYDPSTNKPRSSKSEKYTTIIKPIYDQLKATKGSGTVFLSQDPNVLVNRLELLMASRQAGNTGVNNEIVSIMDELLRQNHITREDYKRVVLGIK